MTCCTLKVKIIFAIVGISAGLMAGPWFAIAYHNVSTTIMALTSSVFAAVTLWMHLAYKKNGMKDWTATRFKAILYTTAVLFLFSTWGMVACLCLAGVWKQGLSEEDLMGENLWMTAVWCFMTAKWTGSSAFFAKYYSSEVTRPLTHTPPIY